MNRDGDKMNSVYDKIEEIQEPSGFVKDENKEFLDDFSARVLSLAIPYKISEYAILNTKEYRKDSDLTPELFFQITHAVLLFIESKAINSKKCSMDDIEEMLVWLCTEKLGLKFNAYRELAVDIVHNVFLNSGRKNYFNTISDNSVELKPYEINLVDEIFIGTGSKAESQFNLTPQGFKYIYLTKELEDLSEVEIDQIKLIKSVKNGNFKGARVSVDNLSHKVEIQRQIIEFNKKFILNQVVFDNINEILKTINDSYDLISEQCSETRRILDLIREFHEIDKDTNIVMWQKVQNGLKDIMYIDSTLNVILGKQLKLVLDVSELIDVLTESIADISFMSVDKKFNILEDILKPLEQEITGEFNPFEIIRGLFNVKENEHMSIHNIVRPQEIFQDKQITDKYAIDYNDDYNEEVDNSELINIEKNNKLYELIFIAILEKVLKHGSISLAEIIEEEPILSKNIAATKVVLVTLYNEADIYLDEDRYIASMDKVENFNPSMIANKYNYMVEGCRLLTYKINEDSVIISNSNDEFNEVLRTPNMLFAIRKDD